MTERFNINLLGQNIGTADGYDFDQSELIQYYNFQPVAGFPVMACACLAVFVHEGRIERYLADKGNVTGKPDEKLDLLKTIIALVFTKASEIELRAQAAGTSHGWKMVQDNRGTQGAYSFFANPDYEGTREFSSWVDLCQEMDIDYGQPEFPQS